MENIKREIAGLLMAKLKPEKVLILSGARRVDKTFLLKELIKELTCPIHLL